MCMISILVISDALLIESFASEMRIKQDDENWDRYTRVQGTRFKCNSNDILAYN
jgi:hypothetical protein